MYVFIFLFFTHKHQILKPESTSKKLNLKICWYHHSDLGNNADILETSIEIRKTIKKSAFIVFGANSGSEPKNRVADPAATRVGGRRYGEGTKK